MDAYSEQLRETYKAWDTEELIAATSSGRLTESAVLAAREELSARGVEFEQVIDNKPTQTNSVQKKPNFFINCWNGKEPLWMAFWVLGFVIGFVVGGVMGALVSLKSAVVTIVALQFIVIPGAFFWYISVWRCAFRSPHLAWGILARVWVLGSASSFGAYLLQNVR